MKHRMTCIRFESGAKGFEQCKHCQGSCCTSADDYDYCAKVVGEDGYLFEDEMITYIQQMDDDFDAIADKYGIRSKESQMALAKLTACSKMVENLIHKPLIFEGNKVVAGH